VTDSSVRQSDTSVCFRLFGAGRSRAALLVALAIALFVRLPGLTSKDLWFDDAWAALPARQSLHTALQMVVTTPGYTLANRFWIGLSPENTWWAQLPTLLFGLLGVIAITALLRQLNTSPLVQFLGAAVVVLSPTTVTYSTRVKEYAFDFLLGVVLLALAERIRKSPTTRNLVELSVVSVGSLLVSFSMAVVVAGVWLATVLLAIWQPELRRKIFGLLAATVTVSLAGVLPFALNVPSVLNHNWRRRGFLFDPSSLHSARRTATAILSGLSHGLFGVPIQLSPSTNFWKLWAVGVAFIVALVISAALVIAFRRTWRSKPTFSRTTPAALALLIAILAAFTSQVPLGDGRTDEALFPSLLVLLALIVGPRLDQLASLLQQRSRVLTTAICLVGLGGGLLFGALHTSRYPTIDLRGLEAKLAKTSSSPATIVTVVDGFNSFGWGYYQLSPTRISFGPDHGHIWPQGFHVASTSSSVVISNNDMKVPGRFHDLEHRASALWYVGFEQGTYNPYTPYPSALHPSATYDELLREGWKPRPGYALLSEHCYAMLLTH